MQCGLSSKIISKALEVETAELTTKHHNTQSTTLIEHPSLNKKNKDLINAISSRDSVYSRISPLGESGIWGVTR